MPPVGALTNQREGDPPAFRSISRDARPLEETRSKKWLWISDLEGTLTGDDGGVAAMAKLGIRVALVLNSSRPRNSVLRTLELLPPDLHVIGLITGMGTEVMRHGIDRPDWSELFEGWDRCPTDELPPSSRSSFSSPTTASLVPALPSSPGHR